MIDEVAVQAKSPVQASRRWRVLVVEDNPINMKIVEVTLRRAGVEMIAARTGTEGLALAREASPDIVLLDLSLPDMEGVDVARALGDAPFPIIAVTAHVFPEDERRVREAGMSGLIGKPIDVHTLVPHILEIRETWSRTRARPGP